MSAALLWAAAQLGHACSTATTVSELETAAERERPDAIISDIELGPGDGVAAPGCSPAGRRSRSS